MIKELIYLLFYLAIFAVVWFVVSEGLMFKRLRELEKHRGHYLFSGMVWRAFESVFVLFGNYHKKDKTFTTIVRNIRVSAILIIILVIAILALMGSL
jgi:ABC-type Fe3+-siderophore transport system permease subunit